MKLLLPFILILNTAYSQDWKDYYVEQDLQEANSLFNIYSLDTIIKTETKWIVRYKITKREFKKAANGGRYMPGPGCKFCGFSFCPLEMKRVRIGIHTEVTDGGDLVQWYDKQWQGRPKVVIPAKMIVWAHNGRIIGVPEEFGRQIMIEPYDPITYNKNIQK